MRLTNERSPPLMEKKCFAHRENQSANTFPTLLLQILGIHLIQFYISMFIHEPNHIIAFFTQNRKTLQNLRENIPRSLREHRRKRSKPPRRKNHLESEMKSLISDGYSLRNFSRAKSLQKPSRILSTFRRPVN